MPCFVILQKRRTLQRKALKTSAIFLGILLWIYIIAFVLKGTSIKENIKPKPHRDQTLYTGDNPSVGSDSNPEKGAVNVVLTTWPTLDFREIHKMRLDFDSRRYSLTLNFQDLIKVVFSGKIVKNKAINSHSFKYEHTATETCIGRQLQLVVLVKSKASNFKMRNAIRTTWGNLTNKDTAIVFFLGHTDQFTADIGVESDIYKDIVQGDFIDSKKNSTFQMVMAFNWAHQFCSKTNFILLVEDDTFINLRNVRRYIKRTSVKQGLFAGHLTRNSSPYRDKGSKWFVSVEEYPFQRYPPYLDDFFILMSVDVALSFSVAIPFVKPIPLANVFLGIVAAKLNIKPRSCPGLIRNLSNSSSLSKSKINFKSVLGYHSIFSPEFLREAWDLYQRTKA